MPQLNPTPWFFIMILSWITLLLLFKNKTTTVSPQNPTTTTDLKMDKTNPWSWPWT
uniref:ATP synthase complex subunit 8 n=1 Tax=Lygosoma quadrupes TaxID=96755 RepID=F2YDW4_9SAUR|nr:ATPase 8 [Lygosoma quadrupes]